MAFNKLYMTITVESDENWITVQLRLGDTELSSAKAASGAENH